jgi:hypothetical protein
VLLRLSYAATPLRRSKCSPLLSRHLGFRVSSPPPIQNSPHPFLYTSNDRHNLTHLMTYPKTRLYRKRSRGQQHHIWQSRLWRCSLKLYDEDTPPPHFRNHVISSSHEAPHPTPSSPLSQSRFPALQPSSVTEQAGLHLRGMILAVQLTPP